VVAHSSSGREAEIQVIELVSGARKTVFREPGPSSVPAWGRISALAWSPDSRQIAFLLGIDRQPDLMAQNADGSSTGLIGRENGALPTQIGMTLAFGRIRPFWTAHGIVGESLFADGGSFIAFYNTVTGKEHRVGVNLYAAAFLAASPDGAHAVYNAAAPEETGRPGALRIADWPGTNDRPFLPCAGSARGDRMRVSVESTTINSRGGNDVVFARNHQRDVIDCGPGIDTAFVERRDILRRCEQVRRVRS
jgi:hypothetical protein